MADALLQIGFFLVMLAIPCAVFVLSTIVAGELRDFFESTSLSVATHLVLTVLFAMGLPWTQAISLTTTNRYAAVDHYRLAGQPIPSRTTH